MLYSRFTIQPIHLLQYRFSLISASVASVKMFTQRKKSKLSLVWFELNFNTFEKADNIIRAVEKVERRDRDFEGSVILKSVEQKGNVTKYFIKFQEKQKSFKHFFLFEVRHNSPGPKKYVQALAHLNIMTFHYFDRKKLSIKK